MSKKTDRQNTILTLIGAHEISSQEELRQLLVAKGWTVTQATLSRDLHDMGVVRAPTEEGTRYLLPEMVADDS
jgi:transcriptional regulator of arginine metabolism